MSLRSSFLLLAVLGTSSALAFVAGCSHAEAQPSDDQPAQGGAAGSSGAAGSTSAGAAGKGSAGTAGGAAGDAGAAGSGTAGSGTAGSGTAGSSGGKAANHLVINEVAYQGATADDEYVELYNPTDADVSLDGWKLEYASASGNPTMTWAGSSGKTIKKKGYYVLAGKEFSGGDEALSLPMAKGGGSLTLSDGGTKVDLVGWGSSMLAEGSAAPADVTESISRTPDGNDTDDNAADFQAGARTPGAAN